MMRRKESVRAALLRLVAGFVIGLLVGYFFFTKPKSSVSDQWIVPEVVSPPEIRVVVAPIVRNSFGEYTEITVKLISSAKPKRGHVLFFSEVEGGELPLSARALPTRLLEVGSWKSVPIGAVSFEPDLRISRVVVILE